MIKEAYGNIEHRTINRTNGVTLSCCHNGVAPFAMQKDHREWRSVRFTALGGQATRVAVVTESVHSPTRKPTWERARGAIGRDRFHACTETRSCIHYTCSHTSPYFHVYNWIKVHTRVCSVLMMPHKRKTREFIRKR